MITVIIAGCAECESGSDEPLLESKTFSTVVEAKAAFAEQGWLTYGGRFPVRWTPHPQGGEHVVVSQGSVWILGEPKTDPVLCGLNAPCGACRFCQGPDWEEVES